MSRQLVKPIAQWSLMLNKGCQFESSEGHNFLANFLD